MAETRALRDERELTYRIDQLQDELDGLYAERAGRIIEGSMVPLKYGGTCPENAWCCCCGRNLVHPIDGFDTCRECLESV